jgi:hypothetical protein
VPGAIQIKDFAQLNKDPVSGGGGGAGSRASTPPLATSQMAVVTVSQRAASSSSGRISGATVLRSDQSSQDLDAVISRVS